MLNAMSEPNEPTSLETLIRADLDHRADAIDSRPLFESIRASSSLEAPRILRLPIRRRIIRWVSGISAAAAAIIIAVLLATQSATPAQASPRELLLEARRQFQAPVDRCYLVEMRKDAELLEQDDTRNSHGSATTQPAKINLLQQSRMTLLWTRGDQFWMTPINAPQPFAWGRGKFGDYWIAMGSRRAVQFAPQERVPAPLQHTADILSMQLDRLLDDVLGSDFNLERQSPTEQQPATTINIRATLKLGHHHPLRSVRIEFDEQTKVVRKLVLERAPTGMPVVTVTYLLVDTEPREDRSYELAGHIEPDAEIFDADNQPGRRMMMMRFFGPGMMEPPNMRPMNPNQPMSVPGQRPFPQHPQPSTQPTSHDAL